MSVNGSDMIIRKILSDIRVDLASEFDRNFERQAFFASAWQRRRSPLRQDGHILVNSGRLRRSIRARSDASSVTFSSSEPYAAIHNEGGEIKVTARMKRYFWHRYYQARGGFKRRKDGTLSRSKTQVRLSTEAEFWKHMALMKVGSTVKIPQRRFLGTAPELEARVSEIITRNINDYLNTLPDKITNR